MRRPDSCDIGPESWRLRSRIFYSRYLGSSTCTTAASSDGEASCCSPDIFLTSEDCSSIIVILNSGPKRRLQYAWGPDHRTHAAASSGPRIRPDQIGGGPMTVTCCSPLWWTEEQGRNLGQPRWCVLHQIESRSRYRGRLGKVEKLMEIERRVRVDIYGKTKKNEQWCCLVSIKEKKRTAVCCQPSKVALVDSTPAFNY